MTAVVHSVQRRTRSNEETRVQRLIEDALGALPDLILLRNSVGEARYVSMTGRDYTVPYGLGVGSPDLVGVLAPQGRWFCLEVKRPGERATAEQARIHTLWRSFGAFVAVVCSVDDARAALSRARAGGAE
jgi:hypothetical protein